MPQNPLTLPELASVVGVEYRTLHMWLRRGLLRPSVRASSGTGTPNLFAFEDVVAAHVMADLRRNGLSMNKLEAVAEALAGRAHELTESRFLLVNGRVELVADVAHATNMLEREGVTLAYATEQAVRHVEAALSASGSG